MLFFFFFFKQKTAYEMRISDWSSDVCSSDLGWGEDAAKGICLASFGFDVCVAAKEIATLQLCGVVGIIGAPIPLRGTLRDRRRIGRTHARIPGITREKTGRSEERRGGKECVSTCRTRG